MYLGLILYAITYSASLIRIEIRMDKKHGRFIGRAGWAVCVESMDASCMILWDRDKLTHGSIDTCNRQHFISSIQTIVFMYRDVTYFL